MVEQDLVAGVSVDVLSGFVPDLVARRFADDPELRSGPKSDQLDVVLLECDLSGFTSFTEGLARLGPAGAEQVSSALSQVFGALSSLVVDHGGDVVKFAGDALLALWPIEQESPGDVVRRASACAFEMQANLKENPVALEHGLAMRAGVGVGPVTALHLGGVDGRWDLAIVGEPVSQVGEAQSLADLGAVNLSADAWRALSGFASSEAPIAATPEQIGKPVKLASRVVPLTQSAAVGLASYIPGTVTARLAAGQTAFIAELRRLSVMFVDLPRLAAASDIGNAQNVVVSIQEILRKYEGSFHKLSIDDKGVKLIGVFGLPPLSHEDDPVRAVLAGREIAREVNDNVSVGITTGRAFSGIVGGESRREFTVIGDMVNLAARLMGESRGGILCDDETYRAAQMRVTFRASRPIAIKGKAEPVTAYSPTGEHFDELVGTQAVAGHTTEMVGRVEEMAAIEESLKALADGRGEVMVIEGEAGIGKSRLVEHLLSHAASRGIRTVVGAGDAIELTTPYRAWRPIVTALIGAENEPDGGALDTSDRVKALFDGQDELRDLIPLIKAIVPVDIADSPLTETMSAEARADNIQLLVAHLLKAVTDQDPLVVVFDDAQWLDPSSWQLARDILSDVPNLGAVVATRPPGDPPPTEYAAFLRAVSPRVLALGPLESGDVNTLICKTLGIEELQDEVVEMLHQKAEGHPMFSKELAYYLRNEGVVVMEAPSSPGRLPTGVLAPDANLADVRFPETVQVVITTRIDRLDVRQQLVVKVASVIGRVFDADLLRTVLPVENTNEQFADDLDQLVAADLIEVERQGESASYVFRHAIIQEVAYELLPFADRRELHRAVASWYEEHHLQDIERYVSLLAHHWTAAGDDDKAVAYQAMAGEQALANFANEEAITYLGAALDIADGMQAPPDSRTLAGWELQMGAAYVHWSRYAEGQHHLQLGLGLLSYPVRQSSSAFGKAWSLIVVLLRQWRNRAFGSGRKVVEAEQRTDILNASRGYTRLVEAAFLSGDQWLALYSSFHALNLAEKTTPSPELAEAFGPVGVIYGAIPLRGEASRYLGNAVDTAREVESLSALGYTLLAHGTYSVGAADWNTSSTMAADLIELGRSHGARKRLNDGLQLQTMISYLQGHFRQVLPVADELLSSARRGHDPRFVAYASYAKAYASLFIGQPEEALDLLGKVESLLGGGSETTDRGLELMHLGLLSATFLRTGRTDEAITTAVSALDRQLGAPLDLGYALPGYAMPAQVLIELLESGSPDQRLSSGAAAASQSLKKFARLYQIARPHARYASAALAFHNGKTGKALRTWRSTLTVAEELDMPFAAARAHLRLAEHDESEDERTRHAAAAMRIFEEQGTPHELALAKKLSRGET